MPGRVPGIHVLAALIKKDVDGRDKPGHDEKRVILNWLEEAANTGCIFGQAPQDEERLYPHGEERGEAARLEP
jgi:hypothetical protein